MYTTREYFINELISFAFSTCAFVDFFFCSLSISFLIRRFAHIFVLCVCFLFLVDCDERRHCCCRRRRILQTLNGFPIDLICMRVYIVSVCLATLKDMQIFTHRYFVFIIACSFTSLLLTNKHFFSSFVTSILQKFGTTAIQYGFFLRFNKNFIH